jgi:hypothetical protein
MGVFLCHGRGLVGDYPVDARAGQRADFWGVVMAQITITETPHYGWCIEADGRFISGLDRGEATAQVAAMLLGCPLLFGGLFTYEEHNALFPWRKPADIAGLLIYQPEVAA